MQRVAAIFERIQKFTHEDGQKEYGLVLAKTITDSTGSSEETNYNSIKLFLQKIIIEIDSLANEIEQDSTILISVRNQKLLRTCYQLVTCLGVSPCLIPGVGIDISKRSATITMLPKRMFSDQQKYELLVECIEFFTRSYKIPVLKNIILTLHLSDYLAALIQLSFAPIKKPGSYTNFTMTQEMFDKLNLEREKFIRIYENLVSNCFQPILMKELLVLQSVKDPQPPAFVKRVITKELSRRLLTPGGLLSLIRCFIESYNIDVGLEWKKIDMISKIVTAKHGTDTEEKYLDNICGQLKQVLALNNTHYLTTAVVCVLNLQDKYPKHETVKSLVKEVFHSFNYSWLESNEEDTLPGTMILTAQEVEHGINVLHACVSVTQLKLPVNLLLPNLQILFLLGMKCSNNTDLNQKVRDIIVKCLEKCNKNEIFDSVKIFLFGSNKANKRKITVVEYAAGLSIKSVNDEEEYPKDVALSYFLEIFNNVTDTSLVQGIFESALLLLSTLSSKRSNNATETLLEDNDDPIIITETDEQYAIILQLLSEISTSPKVISLLRKDPLIILNFTETTILKSTENQSECTTIALVLLNTVLSNTNKKEQLEKSLGVLLPVLKKMANENSMNSILCKEALSLLSSEKTVDTPCAAAVTDMFDNLLPVRAHGIIQITKLIDSKDPETISKKHYIFCLLQEQLKDADSYIYLATINAIAALGIHCTEDVLQFLCKEFLDVTMKQKFAETMECQNKIAEIRMKIGDVIVKVTKGLGDMAIVYKNLLLNTILCGCRDEDPLIRTSALSNLAEIALVLHYRIGTIIYEVLLCIWGIIETDKAIECRRAAVMVISSLLKGLGKETLIQLKDNMLPIYRTLKSLYSNSNEDEVVKLHAQIALEELNSIVQDFLFPELNIEKQIFVLDEATNIFK